MAGQELVPFENFALAKRDMGEFLELIESNLGDGGLSEGTLDRVKMPSGGAVTWTVPTAEGEEDTRTLSGVIIFTKNTRAYWQTSFDEGGGNDVPDCSSRDAKVAFPPGDFEPPASPVEGGGFACSSCALSKFGSADDGSRGQACQMKRLVFLLTENDILPFIVALAPTSLKPANDYLARLTRTGTPYWQVGTKLELQKFDDPKPHARVVMTKAFDLNESEVQRIREYREQLLPHFERVEFQEAA
jgi:hypothetical protein